VHPRGSRRRHRQAADVRLLGLDATSWVTGNGTWSILLRQDSTGSGNIDSFHNRFEFNGGGLLAANRLHYDHVRDGVGFATDGLAYSTGARMEYMEDGCFGSIGGSGDLYFRHRDP
jgi:hypothetical protein